tara:strand:- start:3190 stop:4335 length:1146 start_codon:yes stop_codon:yes gene_type:complete
MKKNILIWGYFGKNNFGDELMLKSILEIIKNFESNIYITIDDRNLKTNQIFQEYKLKSFDLYQSKSKSKIINFASNFLNNIKRLRRIDLLIVGGGTQYFEISNNFNFLDFFLRYIYFLVLTSFNGKLINLNVGIGTINNQFNRYIFSKIINLSELFIVRDTNSKKIAESISKKEIILDTDLSFYKSDKFPKSNNPNSLKIIGINIIDFYNYIQIDDNKRELLKKTIFDLVKNIKNQKYTVKFFACQYEFGGKDLEFMTEIISEFNLDCEIISNKNFEKFVKNFRQCTFHIGMRFHYCLFSIQNKIPCIAISYQSKVKSQFSDLGLNTSIIEMSDLSSAAVLRKLNDLKNCDKDYDKIIETFISKNKISKDKLIKLISDTLI